MKTTGSQILLQASILVLLVFASPSKGDPTHLEKWLNSASTKRILIHSNINLAEAYTIHQRSPVVEEYEQTGQMVTAKTNNKIITELVIRNENLIQRKEIDPKIQSLTNFLPYADNKATVLRLDHLRAHWFATHQLSGCDVWIAMANHEHAEPLIVHINANHLAKNPVENLRYKHERAEEALHFFNSNQRNHPAYSYQLRISYDYARLHPNQEQAINRYWNTYNGPPLFMYSDPAFFYGIYNTAQHTWDFRLKDIIKGGILYGTVCDEDTARCECTISM